MGWDGVHRGKGRSHAEFFQDAFRDGVKVLDAFTKTGQKYDHSTCYMAVEDEDGVHGVLAYFHWSPSSYWNFTYKVVDERYCGTGDGNTDCPVRILDLLTPTDNEDANEWREACRKKAAAKAAKPKVKPGDTVKFAEPITFTDGSEGDTFTLEGRSTFRLPGGWGRVKITRWKDRDYEVVPA